MLRCRIYTTARIITQARTALNLTSRRDSRVRAAWDKVFSGGKREQDVKRAELAKMEENYGEAIEFKRPKADSKIAKGMYGNMPKEAFDEEGNLVRPTYKKAGKLQKGGIKNAFI